MNRSLATGAFWVLAAATVARASAGGAASMFVTESRPARLQQQLQAAADRGYRLVALSDDAWPYNFVASHAVLEKDSREREPIEYLVRPNARGSLEAFLNEKTSIGFRFAAVVGGRTVMERVRNATTRTHEYQILGTRLRQTMQHELDASARKGFRVVGLTLGAVVGIIRTVETENVAILERPTMPDGSPPATYRILFAPRASTLQRELQQAADEGFRLSPAPGTWDSTILIEKTAAAVEPIDYLLLSTHSTATMQQEMDRAAVEGYRFAGVLGSGAQEFVIAMQRPKGARARTHEQVLLATSRFKTMDRELRLHADKGFRMVGRAYFNRALRKAEGIAILERPVP